MSISRSLSTSSTSSTGSFHGVIKLPGMDSKKGGMERVSVCVLVVYNIMQSSWYCVYVVCMWRVFVYVCVCVCVCVCTITPVTCRHCAGFKPRYTV